MTLHWTANSGYFEGLEFKNYSCLPGLNFIAILDISELEKSKILKHDR